VRSENSGSSEDGESRSSSSRRYSTGCSEDSEGSVDSGYRDQ
jgi:hypothetical protein